MINNSFLLFAQLIVLISGILKYDSGAFSGFSTCQSGNTQTYTINFNGVFGNVPQLILGLEKIDMGKGADFRIQAQNIQTTNFELQLNCVTSTPFYSAIFNWYAIDDQRIQVINNFNMENPDNQVFDHDNANAIFGILSITSMGIYHDVDFQISISSITTTQVTVSITKHNWWFVNLKQIGYQIILGIQEALTDVEILFHTSQYNSGLLTQYPNKWLFLSYNGFALNNNIRTRSVRTSMSESYIVETWYGTYINNYHLKSWIAYQFTTVFSAFECLTLRISQALDMEVQIKPKIFLEINEITQSFSSSTYLIIDKALNLLNMKIYMKCTKTKTIASQFLKCQSCSTKQYYKFSHYCHGTIDAVTYFPRFQLAQSFYKELNVNILVDRIIITQVLYNQVQSSETLLDIQVLNS
ncbi:unnamed protein product [Paramecium primaurelia]|uniref:H-type lectin domain-containing protein n=1 Tax=Paramecium primaurelia TaxID=5886 RepID=A0A8S1LZK6_PARPR|nr:unnamed protein product [Paramecium primaurelia]